MTEEAAEDVHKQTAGFGRRDAATAPKFLQDSLIILYNARCTFLDARNRDFWRWLERKNLNPGLKGDIIILRGMHVWAVITNAAVTASSVSVFPALHSTYSSKESTT